MQLRFRLFLHTGILFLIVGLSSLFLQDYLIDRNLRKERSDLIDKINHLDEVKLKNLENYVKDTLYGYQEKINALLTIVQDYPGLRFGFSSGDKIPETWLDSATLMNNNKWIDFVINTKEGNLASCILLENTPFATAELFPVNADVMLAKSSVREQAMVAIPWLLSKDSKGSSQEELADFYILFEPEAVLSVDLTQKTIQSAVLASDPLSPLVQWSQSIELTSLWLGFLEKLKKTQSYLQEHPEVVKMPLSTQVQKAQPIDKTVADQRMDKLIDRYAQIGMIWGMSILTTMGPFGDSPFAKEAPIGILKTDQNARVGKFLDKDQVLFPKSILQTELSPQEGFHNTLHVLLFNDSNRYCLGNTLKFTQDNKTSSLTIGVDGDGVCRELALATNTSVVFVSHNTVISAFNAQGAKNDEIHLKEAEVEELLTQRSGILNYEGEDYCFLHIEPLAGEDFHFFVFATKKEVFFLVDQLNANLEAVVKNVGWQMGLTALGAFFVLLYLLDRIAKKITGPIRALAQAASVVKEGHFESVELPKLIKHTQDEVETLYKAFEDMIKGLKEKEKVRSILNKVVSTDIANEILTKEDLYLGGEEKEVTIFFSDIRKFTELTEEMAPHDVVQMLNACMTKVSKVIDAYHGVIDKYIGDEVMALFGVPLPKDSSIKDAVNCAVEVMKTLSLWNLERAAKGEKKIEMGIGIHHGKVLVGNMGAENRLNYTVLGAHVNLAARLCSQAGPNDILISKEVYEHIKDQQGIKAEPIEPLTLKGFSHRIEVVKIKY